MTAATSRLVSLGHSLAQALGLRSQQSLAAPAVVSRLDASVVLDGDVETAGAIVIEGHVTGDVIAQSVTLAGTGQVSGIITLTRS